jgi:site-specific DNA-cytosine methylase
MESFLTNHQSHTAYGSLETVPGDIDILIAGTSCVDYSNLNNEKQDIDANGESGRTFRGMMSWVENHRPPIVILENVISAPWPRVAKYFEKKKYSASFLTCDTKNYYIPHTRQRKYLIGIDQVNSKMPKKWEELVGTTLKRNASASLDAFLLPSDDPRIHHSRKKLANEAQMAVDKRTQRVDWARCESRHQRARTEEELGQRRPLTGWEEGT